MAGNFRLVECQLGGRWQKDESAPHSCVLPLDSWLVAGQMGPQDVFAALTAGLTLKSSKPAMRKRKAGRKIANVQLSAMFRHMSLADREGLTAAEDALDALPQILQEQAAEDATTANSCSSKDPHEVRPTAAACWFLSWFLGGQLAARPTSLQAANVLRKRQKIKVSGRAPAPMLTFGGLAHQYALPQRLMRNLQQAGWHQPSAVQQQAIPALLAGRELLVVAPTGGPACTLCRDAPGLVPQ